MPQQRTYPSNYKPPVPVSGVLLTQAGVQIGALARIRPAANQECADLIDLTPASAHRPLTALLVSWTAAALLVSILLATVGCVAAAAFHVSQGLSSWTTTDQWLAAVQTTEGSELLGGVASSVLAILALAAYASSVLFNHIRA